MRQSIYLILATTLIKADINRELRKKRKLLRPEKLQYLYLTAHLMRDIGIQPDGFVIGERFPSLVQAKRTVRYLRYLHHLKIDT
ncbi:MAG: hypothetical protein V5786_05955 [Psychromonas sp.]